MNYDIKTTMSIFPTIVRSKAHELIYITRGSSAVLNFNFGKEIYSFADTDQITFILKQGKNLYWYKLFTYLIETEDTTPVEGKIYYKNVKPVEENAYQCTGTLVEEPATDPKAAGYFEVVEENHSWQNTKYLVDPHFSQNSGTGYDYVALNLDSEETKKLKATSDNEFVEFEVAIRLNTDSFASLGHKDSIIIEAQHPIAVVDSLYSKIGG